MLGFAVGQKLWIFKLRALAGVDQMLISCHGVLARSLLATSPSLLDFLRGFEDGLGGILGAGSARVDGVI